MLHTKRQLAMLNEENETVASKIVVVCLQTEELGQLAALPFNLSSLSSLSSW